MVNWLFGVRGTPFLLHVVPFPVTQFLSCSLSHCLRITCHTNFMSMVSTVSGWTPPHKNFKKLYFCWVVPELQLPSTSFLRNPQTFLVCIDQGPDVVYSSSGSWERCGNLPIKFSGHFQRLNNETENGMVMKHCCTAWPIDLTKIKDFYQYLHGP